MRKRKNITVTVDREIYREIRIWCAQRNTCVSHVVQLFLKDLPSHADIYDLFSPRPPQDDDDDDLSFELRLKLMGIDLSKWSQTEEVPDPLPPTASAAV